MPQYRIIPEGAKCYSDVAGPGARVLCVTVPEMVEGGVSDGYIRRILSGQRNGEAYVWPHHKEGNVVYLHYEGLKEKYRAMINRTHCAGTPAGQWIMAREAQRRKQELQAICSNLPAMVEVYPVDLDELRESDLFSGPEMQQIARAAGWLRLWRKLSVKEARRMGFATVGEVQTALFELCMQEQQQGFVRFPKPIRTIRVLDRKAREFAATGMRVLIGGYFGNANRDKIDQRVHAALMDLASSPLKYSFEDIGLIYNTNPVYSALPRLTVSAIKQHLNSPKYKKIWFYLRHGKRAGDNKYQPQAQRDKPSKPDYLWSVDGTTAQLYYKDRQGRIKSDLYVYFVTDVHSGAIIGRSVAFAETSGMVTAALQDAVSKFGYKPRQIQYDNSSANVSDAVRGLMANMSRVHFPCAPYLGRAKYVEEIIGHFQQCVLRGYENFKGGNISVRSENSQANPELLKWLRDNPDKLPTEEQAIGQVMEAINVWNDRGCRRDNMGCWVGESKLKLYAKEYAGRKQLNYFDKLSLFMVELTRRYKYKQQGIELAIDGKKYHFVVPDPDNSANDFLFANENMYREFRVRVNIDNPQYIQLLNLDGKPVATAYEKVRFAACVADMKEGDGRQIHHFLQRQQEYGYDYALRELRAQRQIMAEHELKATGTGGFFGDNYSEKRGDYFGWQDTPKSVFNLNEGTQEDVRNGIEERSAGSRKVRSVLRSMGKM